MQGGYKTSEGEPPAAAAAGGGNGGLRGADVSVGNTLRSALCAVLRSRAPTSVPWRDRCVFVGAFCAVRFVQCSGAICVFVWLCAAQQGAHQRALV